MNDDAHRSTRSGTPLGNEIHRHTVAFYLETPIGRAIPVKVELQYDTREPYAIKASFTTRESDTIDWVFARNLLADGLLIPTGEADVRIRPCTYDLKSVLVELNSPAGSATFIADTEELADFLSCSYDLIPDGDESSWVDFDLELFRFNTDRW